ncbi:hypothetical protein EW145_g2790 [Phellinidium pouzarii]|uniref:PRA1 family protein n=1 Tax=Phellinidium pouzarii TaxID=167371 RepID=A0A4S4L9F3_9AGAM|nr:hypothetical protein EW145_g2790 [Phellinidium pouzarii]
MLVNGADCGPVNPLQGLAKRFDHDRGIQQDQFGAGRAGPSRETFRSAQHTSPALEQEAARFFSASSQGRIVSPGPAPNAFDLSLLHNALPTIHTPPLHASSPSAQLQTPQTQPRIAANWAADFLTQTATQEDVISVHQAETAMTRPMAQSLSPVPARLGMQWTPAALNMNMMAGPQFTNRVLASPSQTQSTATAALWDKEFQSHEASLHSSDSALVREQQQSRDPEQMHIEADDLARTAGRLIDAVQDEQNPKFKNSQFLQLMRGLRDGEIVVNGNDMVERTEMSSASSVDVKGKGKETFQNPTSNGSAFLEPMTHADRFRQEPRYDIHQEASRNQQGEIENAVREEDPNEAYFRQDNEDYINYWNVRSDKSALGPMAGQNYDWGELQESWDSFEATTWGVKPVAHYQFQPHNPYLMGDTSQRAVNHNHMMYAERPIHESVLELEAEVQRNPTSVRGWYDLGVKQQENERESKAISALTRALALDPSHLPSRLALAISHTNEGDRAAADGAIEQWVRRNTKYERLVTEYFDRVERLNDGTLDSLTQLRRHDELIHCLMTMARSGNGEVDADVQIALAVLLNSSEDYLKAQDCFKAALSVRPGDWQLYNRVGATLANSGLSEEAFEYYYRALELNPAYIRARYNLGISSMNMKKYEDAAQYILDALIMQDSDGSVHGSDDNHGITSSTLWDSLRTSCLHLQRIDLATICDRKDLDNFRHGTDALGERLLLLPSPLLRRAAHRLHQVPDALHVYVVERDECWLAANHGCLIVASALQIYFVASFGTADVEARERHARAPQALSQSAVSSTQKLRLQLQTLAVRVAVTPPSPLLPPKSTFAMEHVLRVTDTLKSFREQRLSALRSPAEFFDHHRLSRPQDMGQATSRISYNTRYFSGNYGLIIAVLAVYALIANPILLISLGFLIGGFAAINRFVTEPLHIGGRTVTQGNLYIGLFVVGLPLLLYSSPLGTFFWLVGASSFVIIFHACFMEPGIESEYASVDGGV